MLRLFLVLLFINHFTVVFMRCVIIAKRTTGLFKQQLKTTYLCEDISHWIRSRRHVATIAYRFHHPIIVFYGPLLRMTFRERRKPIKTKHKT